MPSIRILCIAVIVFVSGCASRQLPVSLLPDSVSSPSRIGIAVTPLPGADTDFPGAGCLLCLAAASIANSSLTTHTKTLSNEDLAKIRDEFALAIRKKGATPVMLSEPLIFEKLPKSDRSGVNVARLDFTQLSKELSIDKLLVVQISALGMTRTYANYFPTSAPRGYVKGISYLVNLTTNAYEWYLPFMTQRAADGKWDEPPNFPGLTNAYFQAIETTKDNLLKPFTE